MNEKESELIVLCWKFKDENDLLRLEVACLRAKLEGKPLSYAYWDGERVVSVDPLELGRKLIPRRRSMEIDLKVGNSQSRDAVKSMDRYHATLRDVFAVRPLEEGGLAQMELKGLLEHFECYVGSVCAEPRRIGDSDEPAWRHT